MAYQATAIFSLLLFVYNIWLSIKHHKNPSKASLKKVLLYPLFASLPNATGMILFRGQIEGFILPFGSLLVVGPVIFVIGWVIYRLSNVILHIILIPINSMKKSYDSLPDDTVSEASAIKKAKYEELSISLKELEPEITIDEYGEYQVEGRVLPFKSLHDARAAVKRIKDED
ncbi:hypothetical protein N9296_01225 [Amylibacter sp.]|nr:hypothetical protein [Amylibacter sp.]